LSFSALTNVIPAVVGREEKDKGVKKEATWVSSGTLTRVQQERDRMVE
jgi:hypothetical protein